MTFVAVIGGERGGASVYDSQLHAIDSADVGGEDEYGPGANDAKGNARTRETHM